MTSAETLYAQALAMFDQVGHRAGRLRAQLRYARFLAEQGEAERAAALEREARERAEKIGLSLFEK